MKFVVFTNTYKGYDIVQCKYHCKTLREALSLARGMNTRKCFTSVHYWTGTYSLYLVRVYATVDSYK